MTHSRELRMAVDERKATAILTGKMLRIVWDGGVAWKSDATIADLKSLPADLHLNDLVGFTVENRT